MLEAQRKRIDEIDGQILKLFCERMETVEEVARIKLENAMPVLQPEREKDIIKRRGNEASPKMKEYAEELFAALMAISRSYQTKIIEEKGDIDA